MGKTITKKRRKLREDIYQIIRNDIPLRTKIADQLTIEVQSVYLLAVRQSTKFSLPVILEILEDHLGRNKEEILEPDTI